MKLLHPSNVYEEAWMLLMVTKFLGLYPLKRFKSSRMNYAYIIILIVVYYTVFVNINDYAYRMLKILSEVNATIKIRKIRYYANIILLPTIVLSSVRHSLKVRRVYEEIDNVDKNMKFFNTEIDHTRCMKNDICQITTVMFIAILLNLIDYYGLLDNDKDHVYVIMWILDRTPDFISTMAICSFAVLINKIKFRFEQLNVVVSGLAHKKNLVSVSESSDPNNVFRLRLLKVLQLKLRGTISLVNEAYKFQFIILSVLYIICTCLHMSLIYVESNTSFYVVDVILSVLSGSFDVIRLVHIIHLYRTLTIQYA